MFICGTMKVMNLIILGMLTIETIWREDLLKFRLMRDFDCPTLLKWWLYFCTVSGTGDAIVAPEAPIREQFYKEMPLYASSGLKSKNI